MAENSFSLCNNTSHPSTNQTASRIQPHLAASTTTFWFVRGLHFFCVAFIRTWCLFTCGFCLVIDCLPCFLHCRVPAPRTVPSRTMALNVYWVGEWGECDHLTYRLLTKAGLYSRSSVCHAMVFWILVLVLGSWGYWGLFLLFNYEMKGELAPAKILSSTSSEC